MDGLLWDIACSAFVLALLAALACWRLLERVSAAEAVVRRVLDDCQASIRAIQDSLADLDEAVHGAEETLDNLLKSPLVQSLLGEPAGSHGGDA